MATSESGKPWKAEYAKSAKATCATCKNKIGKEILRLGRLIRARDHDGLRPVWHHATCIMKKANKIKFIDEIEGVGSLRWEDQQKLRKYVDGTGLVSETVVTTPAAYCIEASQTSLAKCKHCSQKIMEGEVRIGARSLRWYHAFCFVESFPSTLLDSLSGWKSLSSAHQASVRAMAEGKAPSADSGLNSSLKSVKDSKVGDKRKHANGSDKPTKKMKVDADKHDSQTNAMVCEVEKAALESELKAQNKGIWGLKDNLKKYVSRQELVLMLEANDQSTSGSELDLCDRCADGMLFGALKRCAMCSGHLSCSGSAYKCHGHISEWSKCSHSTTQSERIEGKWKIPEESDNEYLVKWYKSQAAAKPVRILPPSTSNHAENLLAEGHLKDEKLGNLRVAIAGLPKETVEKLRTEIKRAGGQVHTKIKKGTNCFAVSRAQKLCDQNAELEKARSLKIPIVGDDYLDKCIQYKKKLPFGPYMIEGAEKFSSMVTVKVTGKVKSRSVVREASGHILEDGLSVYNTTLSRCDCKSGTNSYYKLQIIQDLKDDKGNKCYVFRKWGRVGNDNIWSGRIEKMSKSNAIKEFKQLFRKQTGNPWEAWVHKQNFQKLPGKFFPLDIDDGVNKQAPTTKKNIDDENSNLAPALQELIKMLFDVETYRAAMLEFGIDPIKMPLGKLSDSNIQKGFEALAQIENILGDKALQPSVKESRIDDASNKFFNLIPSINPHVIRDEDDLKSKVKMLEALKDVEIASRLVGFNLDSNDPLDEKYRKLHCDMVPLPHSSEDYQLIQKYLLSTHGPTHTKWSLELEEVFSLEREGEHDKFAPQREKLGNRMLLWHVRKRGLLC